MNEYCAPPDRYGAVPAECSRHASPNGAESVKMTNGVCQVAERAVGTFFLFRSVGVGVPLMSLKAGLRFTATATCPD
jgi:hypothetical protein